MRGISAWNYQPYTRLMEMEIASLPYICRIAPGTDSFEFEWFDRGGTYAHILLYRKYLSTEKWTVRPVSDAVVTVEGLEVDQEYEFYLKRDGADGESNVRLARTGYIAPGTVVNYLHPDDRTYRFAGHSINSPTLVRLPSGRLIAGMDLYEKHSMCNLSLLFKSDDNGRSWRYLTDIFPSFWPKLFVHRGVLYLLAASSNYGDLLIGCSCDDGETWSAPTRLLPGGGILETGPSRGPMPVIEHNGRLYTALEYGAWSYGKHLSGVLSIDADADLMEAPNWCCTPFLEYNPEWPGAPLGRSPGCIEGNVVVAPDGGICNYLRIDLNRTPCIPSYGKAVVLRANMDDPEAPLKLDRIVDCPVGSNAKFQMYKDPQTNKYIAIGNEQGPDKPGRTVLSMAVSEDFYTWRIAKRIFDYRGLNPGHVAFQYPDWIFDGEDILLLSRTAWGRSFNSHDANFNTFHRIENFRKYL